MTNSRFPGMVKTHQYERFGFLEKKAHDRLASRRVEDAQGNEWFWAEAWQADYIIRGLIVEYGLAH